MPAAPVVAPPSLILRQFLRSCARSAAPGSGRVGDLGGLRGVEARPFSRDAHGDTVGRVVVPGARPRSRDVPFKLPDGPAMDHARLPWPDCSAGGGRRRAKSGDDRLARNCAPPPRSIEESVALRKPRCRRLGAPNAYDRVARIGRIPRRSGFGTRPPPGAGEARPERPERQASPETDHERAAWRLAPTASAHPILCQGQAHGHTLPLRYRRPKIHWRKTNLLKPTNGVHVRNAITHVPSGCRKASRRPTHLREIDMTRRTIAAKAAKKADQAAKKAARDAGRH